MKLQNMIGDYKKFINKGNIFDLAIGVIIGTTFTAVVNSLVSDIIMPLISSAINFDLSEAKIVLREAVLDSEGEIIKNAITLNYGNFFQNLLKFVIISVAIFIAIKAVKALKNSYIKSQIAYIKKLKKAHPEFFEEEDEFGTKLYEKLKRLHPEQFESEKAKEVQKKTDEASKRDPQEIANELLIEINDKIERVMEAKGITYEDVEKDIEEVDKDDKTEDK